VKAFVARVFNQQLTRFKNEIIEKLKISEKQFYKFKNANEIPHLTNEELLDKIDAEFSPDLYYSFSGIQRKPRIIGFPYDEIRPNQLDAYKRIIDFWEKRGYHAILSAHTGFGKTILALALSIEYKRMHGRSNVKTLYFVRTKEQANRLVEELNKIKVLKGIVLHSRQEMCFKEQIQQNHDAFENMVRCQVLRRTRSCKYFTKLEKIREDLPKLFLFNKRQIEFLQACEDLEICPYYANLELIRSTDVVACCYANLFSSQTRRMLFKRLRDFKCFIVFDEAHNLIELSNDIDELKVVLDRKSFEREDNPTFMVLLDFFRQIEKKFDKLLEELTEIEIDVRLRQEIVLKLMKILKAKDRQEAIDKLRIMRNEYLKKRALAQFKFIYFIEQFVGHAHKFDWFYSIRLEENGENVFSIVYLRKDRFFQRFLLHKSISMSGTLDVKNFISILKLPEKKLLKLEYDYAFPLEKRKIVGVTGMSSLYKSRNEMTYEKYARLLEKLFSFTEKNVGVYFPSYSMLENVLDLRVERKEKNRIISYCFRERVERKNIFREFRGKSAGENTLMIEKFKSSENSVLVGVLGGRNSEGIEFPGSEMEIVVICGMPISPINVKNSRYLKLYGRKNVLYYPAIRKVRQAIGRIFRSESDRGIVIIADGRFITQAEVSDLFPDDLRPNEIIRYNDFKKLKNIIDDFFNEEQNTDMGMKPAKSLAFFM